MTDLSEAVSNTIRNVLSSHKAVVGLHEPLFEGREWEYVKECLDTSWVSSVGKFVDRFEKTLSEYTGVKRAIAVVNGTCALHLSLKIAGVKTGDEVIVPTLTFVATANAVSYTGAIPHFVDSEEGTLGLDPDKLENYLNEISEIRDGECYNKKTGKRIAAVVPMHVFGHPVDLDPLFKVCKNFKLILIEDAAESLGSFYKGKHTGNWGKLSVLSFNGNKIATTGGGGAILTNDTSLADRAKHLSTTAKLPHKWEYNHNEIGYNYRLPNINAALGCAQIENLPNFIKEKRNLAKRYQSAFENIKGIHLFIETVHAKSNYLLNTILLEQELKKERNTILKTLNDNGIQARPVWTLLHKLPMYENCPKMDLTTAKSLEARLINIPSSAGL
jgi:perosamine synthetase